jgi:hypothetical protein
VPLLQRLCCGRWHGHRQHVAVKQIRTRLRPSANTPAHYHHLHHLRCRRAAGAMAVGGWHGEGSSRVPHASAGRGTNNAAARRMRDGSGRGRGRCVAAIAAIVIDGIIVAGIVSPSPPVVPAHRTEVQCTQPTDAPTAAHPSKHHHPPILVCYSMLLYISSSTLYTRSSALPIPTCPPLLYEDGTMIRARACHWI